MIIDSSIAAAICLGEPDAEAYLDVLVNAHSISMGAATYAEAAVVIAARQPGAFDQFVTNLEIEVVPFNREQAEIARDAYRRFGKGTGHPAKLNFGDCLSYAVAVAFDQALLFKGNDFSHTDVSSVPIP